MIAKADFITGLFNSILLQTKHFTDALLVFN